MTDYDKNFNTEIELILEELRPEPGEVRPKGAIVKMEKQRYIDYLVEHGIVKIDFVGKLGQSLLILDRKGFEVYEKYNGWLDYRKKVIDKKQKVDNAKALSTRYWWVPIIISAFALIISVIALFI
jgi:hypothetical protein